MFIVSSSLCLFETVFGVFSGNSGSAMPLFRRNVDNFSVQLFCCRNMSLLRKEVELEMGSEGMHPTGTAILLLVACFCFVFLLTCGGM